VLSRKPPEWLLHLKENEDLSVVRDLGSLAFVRAQGRTLEEQSQEKALVLLWTIRSELESIQSQEQFDKRMARGLRTRFKYFEPTGRGILRTDKSKKTPSGLCCGRPRNNAVHPYDVGPTK
jgi:hypothetical protein